MSEFWSHWWSPRAVKPLDLLLCSLYLSFSHKSRAVFAIVKLFCIIPTTSIQACCSELEGLQSLPPQAAGLEPGGAPQLLPLRMEKIRQRLSGGGTVNGGLNSLVPAQASRCVAASWGSVCGNSLLHVALEGRRVP